MAAFVRLLLRRLRADGYQTWQEGWCQPRMMSTLTRKRLELRLIPYQIIEVWHCAGESQAWNPIGSALVLFKWSMIRTFFSVYTGLGLIDRTLQEQTYQDKILPEPLPGGDFL